MRGPARSAASLAVVLAAAIVFHQAVVVPYRLNLMIRRVKVRSLAAMQQETVASRRMSLENVRILTELMTPLSIHADALMVRALNYRLHGNYVNAVADYRLANVLDERPEIHFQLSRLYLEMGDLTAHEKHRRAAADFHPSYSD